jgi:hypothetical protein
LTFCLVFDGSISGSIKCAIDCSQHRVEQRSAARAFSGFERPREFGLTSALKTKREKVKRKILVRTKTQGGVGRAMAVCAERCARRLCDFHGAREFFDRGRNTLLRSCDVGRDKKRVKFDRLHAEATRSIE